MFPQVIHDICQVCWEGATVNWPRVWGRLFEDHEHISRCAVSKRLQLIGHFAHHKLFTLPLLAVGVTLPWWATACFFSPVSQVSAACFGSSLVGIAFCLDGHVTCPRCSCCGRTSVSVAAFRRVPLRALYGEFTSSVDVARHSYSYRYLVNNNNKFIYSHISVKA